jgi:hypothetical protein
MAAFISSKWQGQGTRIPGAGVVLTEEQVASVVNNVMATLPKNTQDEVKSFLYSESDRLSEPTRVILEAAIRGYVSAMGR